MFSTQAPCATRSHQEIQPLIEKLARCGVWDEYRVKAKPNSPPPPPTKKKQQLQNPPEHDTDINDLKCPFSFSPLSLFLSSSPATSLPYPSSFPLTFPRHVMDIGPCPPGDIFHYHAATVHIQRPVSLLINSHAPQQHSRQAQTRRTLQNLHLITKPLDERRWEWKVQSNLKTTNKLINSCLCRLI